MSSEDENNYGIRSLDSSWAANSDYYTRDSVSLSLDGSSDSNQSSSIPTKVAVVASQPELAAEGPDSFAAPASTRESIPLAAPVRETNTPAAPLVQTPHVDDNPRVLTSSAILLASLLRAHLSAPASPTASTNDGDATTANHTGSSSIAGSSNGREEQQRGDLVMPSMTLESQSHSVHLGAGASSAARAQIRLLVCGRTSEEQRVLIQLLATDAEERAETDLSQSILSSAPSHVFTAPPIQLGYVESVLEDRAGCSFWCPIATASAGDLAHQLGEPWANLERYLNQDYPATRGLVDHVTLLLERELSACLFLFSLPPTQEEIQYARTLSPYIPIIPVLILPSSPKPLKTHVLVRAVSDQLDASGIDWLTASDLLGTSKEQPLFLLPHYLFGGDDDYSSNLASSVEFEPSAPASTGTSRVVVDDCRRLREMVSNVQSRERVRRKHAEWFLQWREVEVAARGGTLRRLEDLPSDWAEKAGSGQDKRRAILELRFSQRVGERRVELVKQRALTSPYSEEEESFDVIDGLSSPSITQHPLDVEGTVGHSAYDPPTPRCIPASLPPLSSSSYDIKPYPRPLVHASDPFHLPSLLSLVGLNLRLALLPVPVASTLQHKYRAALVMGLVGMVFCAGVLAGQMRSLISKY